MTFDLSRLRSFDLETPKFRGGYRAPRIVCGSVAKLVDGKVLGELLSKNDVLPAFKELLDGDYTIAVANGSYDLAIMAEFYRELQPAIFRALRTGKIHDILTAESLNAIYYGVLGIDPRTGADMRNPSTGKVSNRYSLALCVDFNLGRTDAKENDVWRESYALLEDFPISSWPYEAKTYPIDDARNQWEVAGVQLVGGPGFHSWVDLPPIENQAVTLTVCKYCNEVLTSLVSPACSKAPPKEPHKNIENLPAQTEAAFALHLGACHSFRTDPERVEKLATEVEAKHTVAVVRFQKKGWIRGPNSPTGEEGTEDTAAVKRAIATAYGARKPCKRCNGTGRTRNPTKIDCRGSRGPTGRGRYQGCLGEECNVCGGLKRIDKYGNEITCKNIYDDNEVLRIEGCDGSGFDLSDVPALPRTDKMGVKTNRDTKMESGDDDMSDYGEDEFEKSRTTYVPYLRTGISAPLYYSPNVLVATGRCSYESSPLHQMPRHGGERECVRARGAWCGYPIEMVFGSTDYSAGELCTLAQLTYWLFSYSQMKEAINTSGDPGILHSELAAEVLGVSLDEFLKRLKAKDKQAIDFRQASKPENFGKPAGMGSPKIVLTNRAKSTGFTVCERGPTFNKKKEPGYWGIRFCVLIGGAQQCGIEKITEWKNYPCAPVCKACVEVEANILSPAYFRRFPEIKDYHRWGNKMIEQGRPAPVAVWDRNENAPRIVRERGDCDYSSFLNNGFQGMLSDIGKHAYVTATRECYLGVKEDGSASPLHGSRLPLFSHDEPVSELIFAMAHLSGPRIAEIMMASGSLLAPDVTWKAETALAFYLSKSMEPVYTADRKLIPWEPTVKAA